MHTTRDQATAMAIPGHKDEALSRFEDGLYMELGRQHERLQLFVSSKADEISRRLEHLAKNINRWASKSQDELADNSAIKHQRRFTKYERELVRCGGDIHALERFVNAQTVAFRKITKKYKVRHRGCLIQTWTFDTCADRLPIYRNGLALRRSVLVSTRTSSLIPKALLAETFLPYNNDMTTSPVLSTLPLLQ
jgi:hypothetical protein